MVMINSMFTSGVKMRLMEEWLDGILSSTEIYKIIGTVK
jgi:hypothetical protein